MNLKTSLIASLFCFVVCGISSAQTSGVINGTGVNNTLDVNTDGGFNITQVSVDGTVLVQGVDYTIQGDGSSSPTIKFVNPPANGAVVKVTGVADNTKPNLQLSWAKSRIYRKIADAILWNFFGL